MLSTLVLSKRLMMPKATSHIRSTWVGLGPSTLRPSSRIALCQISLIPLVSNNTALFILQQTSVFCRMGAMEHLRTKHVSLMIVITFLVADFSLATRADVLFAEYGNTGDGSNTSQRQFSTALTSASVAKYSISAILGSGYEAWVDPNYL
jgi:hypothetical protein